jgi:hypothetical protein
MITISFCLFGRFGWNLPYFIFLLELFGLTEIVVLTLNRWPFGFLNRFRKIIRFRIAEFYFGRRREMDAIFRKLILLVDGLGFL